MLYLNHYQEFGLVFFCQCPTPPQPQLKLGVKFKGHFQATQQADFRYAAILTQLNEISMKEKKGSPHPLGMMQL